MIAEPMLGSIVDLDRYPIDHPHSPEWNDLVRQCRSDLMQVGAATLAGFVLPAALAQMAEQAQAVAPLGFPNDAQANIYFTEPDPTLPSWHPNRRLVRSAQKAVAKDQLPDDFATKVIYQSDDVTQFVAAVVGDDEPLYRSADPLDGCNMTVYEVGDELGWHFDNSDFSVTLMIRPAVEGGVFQYVPAARSVDDECFETIASILEHAALEPVATRPTATRPTLTEPTVTQPIVTEPTFAPSMSTLPGAAGDLAIFRGRYALHRVTPVESGPPRFNSVLTYSRRPDHRLTPMTAELFYGRQQ